MGIMPPALPQRGLCDWDPANPQGLTEDEWLAGWARAGWLPEWPPPYGGAWCVVGGHGRQRWAMVRSSVPS